MLTVSRKITSLLSSVGEEASHIRVADDRWLACDTYEVSHTCQGRQKTARERASLTEQAHKGQQCSNCCWQSSKNKTTKALGRQNEFLTLVLFYFSLLWSRWPQYQAMSLLTFWIPHSQKWSSVRLSWLNSFQLFQIHNHEENLFFNFSRLLSHRITL